jgi:cobalt-zinc-cadmium efflux system outer membrane protein
MRKAVASNATGTAGAAFGRLRLYRGWIIPAVLSAVSVLPVAADEALGTSLTLDQMILTAQKENKDLRAARYAVDIAQAKLIQAGTLPNPRLNIGGGSDFAFNNDGAYTASFGISQDFPVTGRLLRQKDVARVDVELAQVEIEDAQRRLAGEVAANVYRVLIVDRQLQARDALRTIDERLAKTTHSRYKAAEVSELDVNAVTLDLQKLGQERATLDTQRRSLLQSLNRQLGRPASTPLTVTEPLPVIVTLSPVDAYISTAWADRPDLHQAQLQVDRAEADIALAKSKRWEDWSIGLGVQQDRLVIDGAPSQRSDRALSFNVTIPLSLSGIAAEA